MADPDVGKDNRDASRSATGSIQRFFAARRAETGRRGVRGGVCGLDGEVHRGDNENGGPGPDESQIDQDTTSDENPKTDPKAETDSNAEANAHAKGSQQRSFGWAGWYWNERDEQRTTGRLVARFVLPGRIKPRCAGRDERWRNRARSDDSRLD